jgi:hypothetical protein
MLGRLVALALFSGVSAASVSAQRGTVGDIAPAHQTLSVVSSGPSPWRVGILARRRVSDGVWDRVSIRGARATGSLGPAKLLVLAFYEMAGTRQSIAYGADAGWRAQSWLTLSTKVLVATDPTTVVVPSWNRRTVLLAVTAQPLPPLAASMALKRSATRTAIGVALDVRW